MSIVWYPEIIYYAVKDRKLAGKYYPYLVKALRHLTKGTYSMVRERLIRKIQKRGLDPNTFETLVKKLESVQYTDLYLTVIEFDHEFRYLLSSSGICGSLSNLYYAFALRIKRIITLYKGKAREKLIEGVIKHYTSEYFAKEEVLRSIVSLVLKTREKIDKVLKEDTL